MTKGIEKESWVDFELQTVNFGDKRLNNRLGNILEKFSSKPSVSIPNACNAWYETKAAYRFFDNGKVDDGTVAARYHRNRFYWQKRYSRLRENRFT